MKPYPGKEQEYIIHKKYKIKIKNKNKIDPIKGVCFKKLKESF